MLGIARWLGILVVLSAVLLPAAAAANPGADADATITVDPGQIVRPVPPGVVGWGAMWKRGFLQPTPPDDFSDASHAAYIQELGTTLVPLIRASDTRHLSWPWGVSFSTWGVNWENSARPWSDRPLDCARIPIINHGSGWCEKTIVGVGDLMTLAEIWGLEAITVSVPLSVLDGSVPRWGPGFFDQAFPPDVIEQVSDHARALVDFMKAHPAWDSIPRIFLAAGCEWRHYKLENPSSAVLTYAALVRRIREKIPEAKVIIVASASDSADIPGPSPGVPSIEAIQAASWNQYLHEGLVGIPGIALDLHRYRGMIGAEADADGTTPMTPANIDVLLSTGVSQWQFLAVHPEQWGGEGAPMPSVLLENAIHGKMADHSTHSDEKRPWPVAMAHADLVREALASPALAFLGWTWFPEDLPAEWPHGALRDGELALHARAQAFLSRYHRGSVVASTVGGDDAVRANAVLWPNGALYVYGGNFSRDAKSVALATAGSPVRRAEVQILREGRLTSRRWGGRRPLRLPPMSLFRMRVR